MFADLDLLFFGGCLQGNVLIDWVRYPKFRSDGKEETLWGSEFPSSRYQQSGIILNAPRIFRSEEERPFQRMWETMLHEMW